MTPPTAGTLPARNERDGPPIVAIEAALRRHPAVFDATVASASNPYWGKILTARVGLKPLASPVTPGDIAAWLAAELGPAGTPRRIYLDAPSPPATGVLPA
ncbi:AMP-binding enzyme [Marinivivus vitaminiproducens]|uniref:AMP-binding enzyme n=1 Tax=Marinivivus vitaminiproducens TaxID=3035935 RepID=UPI0027996433|nr:hypothetical protein P4R82_09670 [Geminicoccaceae bacterium SCSIO 64248]